jgi:hypothetical protein
MRLIAFLDVSCFSARSAAILVNATVMIFSSAIAFSFSGESTMHEDYRTMRLLKTLIFEGFLESRIKIANELGALLNVIEMLHI